MSNWTYVSAMIRIDKNPDIDGLHSYLDSILNEGIPTGSEGSLYYDIIKDKRSNDNRFVYDSIVVIYGELRDYEDSEYVKEWFLNICKNESIFINSAIIEIKVTDKNTELLRYNHGNLC